MTEVEEIKKILKEHQYRKIHGMIVDAQTANVMLKVREALKKETQIKFDNMLKTPSGFRKVADFSWKQVR